MGDGRWLGPVPWVCGCKGGLWLWLPVWSWVAFWVMRVGVGFRGVVIGVDQWLLAELGGFGLLWKRDRWLLVEVMGLGCYGRGIGGCGFGVEKGLMAIGRWLWLPV